jgi:hypothetical protein
MVENAIEEYRLAVSKALVLSIQAEHTGDPVDHGNAEAARNNVEQVRDSLMIAIGAYADERARTLQGIECWLDQRGLGQC